MAKRYHLHKATVLLVLALIEAVSVIPLSSGVMAAEQAIAPEKNPPGDIPDSQVFVDYRSKLGFSIKVPEGWSRNERTDGVHFADKFGDVDVSITTSAAAPTVETVKASEAAALEKSARAVKITAVRSVKLASGPGILIQYTSNSEPSAVTNRQIRLEHDRYLLSSSGKLATIDLSAPDGADNVDQWTLMSGSFRWQ